jgi:hypothetical protein
MNPFNDPMNVGYFFLKSWMFCQRCNNYFCIMAENYRKPTNSNAPIPFSVEAEGLTYSGTLTPSGKLPSFGMPNTFLLRMAGKPTMTISIYMGKWVMQGSAAFVQALSEWINNYYR